MNAHYPSDYPDGFEEKLIAAGAKNANNHSRIQNTI